MTGLNHPHLRHLFAHPSALMLLGVLPVLLVMAFVARRRRRRVLARLGRLPALAALTERRQQWGVIRGLCALLGLTALVFGIAGPQWGLEPDPRPAPGRDLVVVLDLSRSMLADDAPPSRQQRAKDALIALVEDTVKKHGGHRLALVAFAAGARVICPLTNDLDHFLTKLRDLDAAHLPRDLRPREDSVSGTRIGEALRMAVQEAHEPHLRGYQDILLITDGDDPVRDGEWLKGTEAAREAGVPVYVVGVGDAEQGGRIPAGKESFLMREGKPVVSRLDREKLQEIARRTRGEYVEAGTGPLPLRELFLSKIEPGERTERADDRLPQYMQRYPWFFGLALSLLAAEMTFGAPLGLRRLLRRASGVALAPRETQTRGANATPLAGDVAGKEVTV